MQDDRVGAGDESRTTRAESRRTGQGASIGRRGVANAHGRRTAPGGRAPIQSSDRGSREPLANDIRAEDRHARPSGDPEGTHDRATLPGRSTRTLSPSCAARATSLATPRRLHRSAAFAQMGFRQTRITVRARNPRGPHSAAGLSGESTVERLGSPASSRAVPFRRSRASPRRSSAAALGRRVQRLRRSGSSIGEQMTRWPARDSRQPQSTSASTSPDARVRRTGEDAARRAGRRTPGDRPRAPAAEPVPSVLATAPLSSASA